MNCCVDIGIEIGIFGALQNRFFRIRQPGDDFGVDFQWFLEALGAIFQISIALGAGSKVNAFLGLEQADGGADLGDLGSLGQRLQSSKQQLQNRMILAAAHPCSPVP